MKSLDPRRIPYRDASDTWHNIWDDALDWARHPDGPGGLMHIEEPQLDDPPTCGHRIAIRWPASWVFDRLLVGQRYAIEGVCVICCPSPPLPPTIIDNTYEKKTLEDLDWLNKILDVGTAGNRYAPGRPAVNDWLRRAIRYYERHPDLLEEVRRSTEGFDR